MEKFKSKNKKGYYGKRVKVVKAYLADSTYVGKTGTIVGAHPGTWYFEVKFDPIYKDDLSMAYGSKLLFPLNCLEIFEREEKLEESNHHISSIFKIDGKEHYLTVSLNGHGEGHVDFSDEDTHGPLFHVGTLDGGFTDVITDAAPIFTEICKFLQLIKERLKKNEQIS